MAGFPAQQDGVYYLTEGGQETELMYKHGHELPEFALYPLLDDRRALADLTAMYTAYLEVAAEHQVIALMGGLDYRASPDWSMKLGISAEGLEEFQLRSIDFLREVAKPFQGQIPQILIAGCVGPRGDAYGTNRTITAEDAEDYHGVQLTTLKKANVDVVEAMTFNGIPEAIGVSRAAATVGLPLSMSFMVNREGNILSGAPIRDAIEAVDAEAGDARPDFYGINCSHPTEFVPALTSGEWLKRIRNIRPNASPADKQALCEIGHLEAGHPPDLGRQVAELVRRFPHIDIVGGCCGTWDDHLRAIAGELTAA